MDSEPNTAFEQYKLVVEDTGRLNDRRQTMNNLYLSANSLLLGGIALLVVQSGGQAGGVQSGPQGLLTLAVVVLIAAAGGVVCFDWRRLILGYKRLLRLRYQILQEMEADDFRTPQKVYQRERDELQIRKKDGRARGRQTSERRFSFSDIEANIPFAFAGIYVIVLVMLVVLRYSDIAHQLAAWGIKIQP